MFAQARVLTPQANGTSLFRQEAMSAHSGSGFGRALVWQPRWLSGVVLAVLAVVLVAAATVLSLTWREKVTVTGYVEPLAGVAAVIARDAGVVRVVHVREGAQVVAGDKLVTLDTDRHHLFAQPHMKATARVVGTAGGPDTPDPSNRTAADSLGQTLTDGLRSELTALQHRALIQEEQLRQSLGELDIRAVEFDQMFAAMSDERRLLDDRISLVAERMSRVESLVTSGVLTRVDLDVVRSEWLALRQEQAAGMRQALQMRTERARVISQQQRLRDAHVLSGLDLAHARRGVQEQLARVVAQSATLLVAPIAGRVTLLQARAGSAVAPGTALLQVVPLDDRHRVVLFAPSSAVGEVSPGMSVVLRYSALPFDRHGAARGEVLSVSDSVVPAEVAGSGNEPMYRVLVAVRELPSHAERIRAGMLVQADLVTRQERLWQRLRRPLQEAWARV